LMWFTTTKKEEGDATTTPRHSSSHESSSSSSSQADALPTPSRLLQFLEDKPRVAKAVQRWVIDTDGYVGPIAGSSLAGSGSPESAAAGASDTHHSPPLLDTTASWHFRSLFVVEATLLNMSTLFFFLFFWVINRNTHLRPTKGTTIVRKPTVYLEDDDDDDVSSVSSSDDDEEDDEGEDKAVIKDRNKVLRRESSSVLTTPRFFRKYRRRSSVKSTRMSKRLSTMQRLVAYGIEQGDDDDGWDSTSEAEDLDEEVEKLEYGRALKDLLRVTRTLGYLNETALTMCAQSAKYETYQKGNEIFNAETFDGTLYGLVSGKVELTFHDFEMHDDFLEDLPSNSGPISHDEQNYNGNGNSEVRRPLKLILGPDKQITSSLALLWGMISKMEDAAKLNDDSTKEHNKYPLRMSVRAISDDTEVIRVSPECLSRVLEEHPVDIFRISGTVLNRLQRITVQTLVKTLGLRKDLLAPARPIQQYEKDMVNGAEWKQFDQEMKKTGFCEGKEIVDQAIQLFQVRLGIDSEMDAQNKALLRENAELVLFEGKKTLIEAGSKHESCYLLLQGYMENGIYTPTGRNPNSFHRHQLLYPGALLGEHECVTGEFSLTAVKSIVSSESANCMLLKVPKNVYNKLITSYPKAMARALDSLLHQISPSVYLLQATSDWLTVTAATNVARRGTSCDSLYMVLNGRLRSRQKDDNNKAPAFEYGRGKVVGEIGLLSNSSWQSDLYAIRHSEIAKVPIETLLSIVHAFPKAGLNFARSVALQVQEQSSSRRNASNFGLITTGGGIPRSVNSSTSRVNGMPSYGLNLATIAVVPMDSTGINLNKFCSTLTKGFQKIAPSRLVTKESMRKDLGDKGIRYSNSALNELRMVRSLAEMEENHRLVIYQADPKYTWWTRLCIQQADCILLVVSSDRAPEGERIEQSLAWAYESMDVRIDLVVVGQDHEVSGQDDSDDEDDEDFDLEDDEEMNVSDQLNNWSEQRKWISGHHLVRAPIGRHKLDFHRLCRRVTGRAVGLVLGSGGARGLAHLGVMRALKEAGVTIDLVGGTSQGAFVGALYARQPDDLVRVESECRKMAAEMSSMRSKLLDLTLPMTSIFSGYMFNRGIRKRLGNLRVQDLVLNFFCVSVDLQKQKEVVHRKGLLWKYVRASMSLTGYLPPIAEDGQLLVDGAYMNSVPTDVMRYQMGARIVIAIDTNGELERDHYMWGNSLNGWWVLWNSMNPFSETVRIPSMGDLSDLVRKETRSDICMSPDDNGLSIPFSFNSCNGYHQTAIDGTTASSVICIWCHQSENTERWSTTRWTLLSKRATNMPSLLLMNGSNRIRG